MRGIVVAGFAVGLGLAVAGAWVMGTAASWTSVLGWSLVFPGLVLLVLAGVATARGMDHPDER